MLRILTVLLLLPTLLKGSTLPERTEISGRVIDVAGSPLTGAVVVLADAADSTRLQRTVADADGRFSFSVEPGLYVLSASFIGFSPFTAQVDARKGAVVDIQMREDSRQLGEVIVKAQRISYDAEGYRMNVAGDKLLGRQPLDAIVQMLPGVFFNGQSLSLFGRQVSAVYVNRRRLRLHDRELMDYLAEIRGSNVRSIQVITATGAEESARAAGSVIIKIQLERQNDGGQATLSTIWSASKTNQSLGNPSVNFQNRSGKWSAYGRLGTRIARSKRSSSSETEFLQSGVLKQNEARQQATDRYASPMLGIGYDLSANDFITAEGEYRYQRQKPHAVSTARTTGGGTAASQLSRISEESVRDRNGHASADYVHTWPSGELSVGGSYSRQHNDDDVSQWREGNVDAWNSVESGWHRYNTYTFRTDYTQQLGNKSAKAKAGAAFTAWNNRTATDNVLTIDGDSHTYGTFSDLFAYREQVAALYGSLDYSRKRFGLSAGLRYEHQLTHPRSSVQPQQNYRYSTDRLYPNLRLSYTLDRRRGHNLRLNYAFGLTTPRMNMMNPARHWSSEYSYAQGNPYLRPHTSQTAGATMTLWNVCAVNLGYGKTAIYRQFTHKEEGRDVAYTQPDDRGRSRQLSLAVALSKRISARWMLNAQAATSWNRQRYLEQRVRSSSQSLTVSSVNQLPKAYSLRSGLLYMSPTKGVDARQGATWQWTESIGKTLLKGRLNLLLSYGYQPTPKSSVSVEGIRYAFHSNSSPHQAMLTGRYNLKWGSQRAKVRRSHGMDAGLQERLRTDE